MRGCFKSRRFLADGRAWRFLLLQKNTERTEKNGNFSSKRRITQIIRIKGGSRSITSELLEFFAGGGAWRLFYCRKILKELKNTETFLRNGELRKLYELRAGAGIDAPCPAGRDLVDPINYCAARISVRGRGRFRSRRFLAGGRAWRFLLLQKNTERTEKNGNFSSKRRITQIIRIKGGSRSIIGKLLELIKNGEFYEFYELGREPVNY